MITLDKTERLILRDLTEDDFAGIHAYASDPEVCKSMAWGPNTLEDTRKFIAAFSEEREVVPRVDWSFGVIRISDAHLIGACSFHIECFVHKAASIGYALRRDEWGKGYATEAAGVLLQYGFHVLGMHRIWATCRLDNTASANVLKKIGMQYEGTLRHHVLIRGRWRDSLLFAAISDA